MHTLPPSSLAMQEKKPPNEGGKQSQTGGGVWDSHQPPSMTLWEWEGVGSRRHICAILPLRQLWGATTGYVVAPCPPSPLVLTKNPGNDDDQVVVIVPAPLSRILSLHLSFPTIPTSCRFLSVVIWWWWHSTWAVSLSLAGDDVAAVLGVVRWWHGGLVGIVGWWRGVFMGFVGRRCWVLMWCIHGRCWVLLGGVIGCEVAGSWATLLGAGRVDELTLDWPKSGRSLGGPTAAVAATRNSGGGGWWWW